LKLLETLPRVDVISKAACNFPGHGATRNLDLERGVVKEGDGNWGTVNMQGGVPSSVSVCIRDVVSPFFICPFCCINLPKFSMPPNPFGLEVGAVCPVSCRDNNISVNGIVDGVKAVVVS